MIITTRDVRAAGMCISGAKAFFDNNGLDWKTFIREGIEEEELLKTENPLAVQVVEAAHGRG